MTVSLYGTSIHILCNSLSLSPEREKAACTYHVVRTGLVRSSRLLNARNLIATLSMVGRSATGLLVIESSNRHPVAFTETVAETKFLPSSSHHPEQSAIPRLLWHAANIKKQIERCQARKGSPEIN
jgi:hypothetical protein